MNTIPTTISASKDRSNFYTLLKEVNNKFKRFVIVRRGEAQGVLIHPEEVASWEETMEVLADKKLVGQIFESERERKTNKTVSEKKLLKELGISSKELK